MFGGTNNGPPPQSGRGPQISAQQAAGLASAAYSVHQALPPEMKAKVNQMAADQATAYVHQKLGMPPPQSQAPGGAAATPSSGFSCLSLFGMGSSPPAHPTSTSSGPGGGTSTTSGGTGTGGMMDMASSFLSFGAAPHKPQPQQEDPNSFTHLWNAAGPEAPPNQQHQPASKPAAFDFTSMFMGQPQQQPMAVPPAGGGRGHN